eukprot:32888_1
MGCCLLASRQIRSLIHPSTAMSQAWRLRLALCLASASWLPVPSQRTCWGKPLKSSQTVPSPRACSSGLSLWASALV